jgi:hypothetical protein
MKIPNELSLLLLVALVVLAAAIPTQVNIPGKFYKMVEDKTNVLLLLGLCFLVSYCNFPLGVMMSLFVFMVMVNSPNYEGFENNDIGNNIGNNIGNDIGNDVIDDMANNMVDIDSMPSPSETDPSQPMNNDEMIDELPPASEAPEIATSEPNVSQPEIQEVVSTASYDDTKYETLGGDIEALNTIYNKGKSADGAAQQFCDRLKIVQSAVKCPSNIGMNNTTEQFASNGGMLNNLANNIGDIADDMEDAKLSMNNRNNSMNNSELNSLSEPFTNRHHDEEEDFMPATSNEPSLSGNNECEGFIGKQLREQFSVMERRDGHDYDVVGCRYDLNGNFTNEFLQGPPLAKCNIYDVDQVQNIGCEFYPINP